jgi:UDPglucose 6-dehydrogenase
MKVTIVGTGYVGLVTGTCFAEMGNDVHCIENNPAKLNQLKNSEIPIFEPGLEVLFHRNINQKRITFSNNLERGINEGEIIFLCLPTPPYEDGSADLKHVFNVATQIGQILAASKSKENKVIVNKSTVPVGTAKKVKELIAKYGNENFAVVSNPEFLREGFAVEDFMKPDRIVIGSDNKDAVTKMKKLYEPFVRQGNPIIEMDAESSEVTKYAANSYLAMRITYMNQLANFCENAGANVDLVRKGMGSDTRIGKRFLFPGIGYGGSCFPKDVKALIHSSKSSDAEMKLLTLVDELNEVQKKVLVSKLLSYYEGNLEGKKFAVWGLAFKPNTDDMREAPSITIINSILKLGGRVAAYDPVAMEKAKECFGNKINYAENEYEACENADAILILTEWNEFRNPNFERMNRIMKDSVIFDGRNLFDPNEVEEKGFSYLSIGRKAVIRNKHYGKLKAS